MFGLPVILKAIQAIGPITAALPDVKKLIDQGIAALSTKDQAVAKDAYDDLIADNAAGHARLQDKLREAARR
jgi:hypothetical protein